MATKIENKKKLLWTHMMEMIPFHLIFPNVVGFYGAKPPPLTLPVPVPHLDPLFHIYTF